MSSSDCHLGSGVSILKACIKSVLARTIMSISYLGDRVMLVMLLRSAICV